MHGTLQSSGEADTTRECHMPSAVHHYLSGHPIVVGVVIAPIVHSVFLCNGLLLCDCIDAAHGIPVQRDRRAMRPCVMRVIGTNLDVPEAPFPDTALSRVLRMLTLRVEPHGPNPILSAFRGRRNDVGLSSRGGCHRDDCHRCAGHQCNRHHLQLGLFSCLNGHGVLHSRIRSFRYP